MISVWTLPTQYNVDVDVDEITGIQISDNVAALGTDSSNYKLRN